MSVLDRLLSFWRKTFTLVTSEQVRYVSATTPQVSFEALARDGWRRNELIYACISRKAETASQVALRVVDRDGVVVSNHRLQRLIDRPNSFMSMSEFLQAIIILKDLAGFAPFVKQRSSAGLTIGLYPLRPDWLKIELDANGQIAGYRYTAYASDGYFDVLYPAEDVVVFSNFDPLGNQFGYPPVAVLARTGDMDNMVTDYLRSIFAEGGVPPGILKTTKSITKAIAQQIREMYIEQYGGYKSWRAPMVLGEDTTYQKTGLGIDEMGLDVLDERAEARICAVLKVPPAIVGARIGLKRALEANIIGFHRNWWVNDLIPIYESIEDKLNNAFADELGDYRFSFDYSDVYALSEDVSERRKIAIEAFKVGAITRNEFNRLWGLPELGDAGDVYLVPQSLLESGKAASGEKSNAYPLHTKRNGYESGEYYDPNKDELRIWAEGLIKPVVMKHLENELRLLLESDFVQVIAETRGEASATVQVEKKQTSDFWMRSQEQFYALLYPVMVEIYRRMIEFVLSNIETPAVGIDWDIYNEWAIEWARRHTAEVVAQVSRTSMDGFLAEFDEWVRSGKPLPKLTDALKRYYDPVRAEMVAVTETTRAFASVNIQTWGALGYVDGFDWVTAIDELVCPICSEKQSQNPHALTDEHPPAHVRCRCAVRPVMRG